MPKGVYERTEEQNRKIGESRKRFYDQHGRVVEIDQREDPKGYQREYQRQWRARHPHYYRDRRRIKAVKKGVTLENIVVKFNEIQARFIECKYRNERIQSRRIEIIGN